MAGPNRRGSFSTVDFLKDAPSASPQSFRVANFVALGPNAPKQKETLMFSLHPHCPKCFNFVPTAERQCQAIQTLIRPDEARALVPINPRPFWVPVGYNAATAVGGIIKSWLAQGVLRYIPDPPFLDRWCTPMETVRRRGGDCDDFAILAASIFTAAEINNDVVTGHYCGTNGCNGHAWVEGHDEHGWFLLEAVYGDVYRSRPRSYAPILQLRPGVCRRAG